MLNNLYKKMNDNKSNNMPFIVLLIILIVIHCIIKLNYADDLYFAQVLDQNKLFTWLIERYDTWSSRVIVEAVLVIVMHFGEFLWKLFDIAMFILLAVSISKLFVKKNVKRYNWIIVGLILIYPLKDMSTAGWAATTINYIWPLSLGLYCLTIVKKILKNENIKIHEYIFSVIALIYATNVEQMCAILLAIYIPTTVYLVFFKKKNNVYIILQSAICTLSLILTLSCPGNAIRNASETLTWFPEFVQLSFIDKFLMGYSSSLAKFIFEPNALFMIAVALVFILVSNKEKSIYIRIFSSIPLICNITFGFIGWVLGKVMPNFPNQSNSMTKYGITDTFPLIILTIVGVSFIYSIYIIFKNNIKSLICIYILLLGVASRIVIGFSPTIWASNDRTFLYMYFSIILCCLMLYQEAYELKYKNIKYIDYLISFWAVISCVFSCTYAFILKVFLSKENLIEFIKGLRN